MSRNTLGKSERLKSEKSISGLFETGKSISVYPLRIIYQSMPFNDNSSIKIGFAVSKKNFKRAVDRNLLKRRMREAYRINKQFFPEKLSKAPQGLEVMIVYQGKIVEDYEKISLSINELFKKLELRVRK